MKNVCKNVSPRQTDLFFRFCWIDSAWSPFPATTTQLFSQNLSSHILCSCLEILFLPLTTYAVSGTANSNKSAPTRFAAGTIYLRKNGIAVLAITCASAPNLRPRYRSTPL